MSLGFALDPHGVTLREGADHEGFRRAVRRLANAQVPPHLVAFSCDGMGDLFPEKSLPDAAPVALPRAVTDIVALVVCHRDPERYGLLYRLIWRVLHGEREVLNVASDPLVHRLDRMARTIRRDIHKMHAFVRFRYLEKDGIERYVAWFEPEHFILEAIAPFFIDRFRSMDWAILTPIGCLRWDRTTLHHGPPALRGEAPLSDAFEAGWRTYYESVFNPARLNPQAMRAEMPKKYWRNLPESASIRTMIQFAPKRVEEMIETEASMPTKRIPARALEAMADQQPKTLAALNATIDKAGPLVPGATRAVFGEGPDHADIVFVGEQPGDQEDLQGRPFVGPAGQLLSRAMAEAGIARNEAYLTNAVKHFKFELRGKRRIHSKPTAGEIKHYRPWLIKELELVHPKLVVALGATALQALAGKALPVSRMRGETSFEPWRGYVTVHPSYLLRLPDADAKEAAYTQFVKDLRRIRAMADAA